VAISGYDTDHQREMNTAVELWRRHVLSDLIGPLRGRHYHAINEFHDIKYNPQLHSIGLWPARLLHAVSCSRDAEYWKASGIQNTDIPYFAEDFFHLLFTREDYR
jgi:hypothetical protein